MHIQATNMPSRGQEIFIFYLIAINVILSVVGYWSRQRNSWYLNASGSDRDIISYMTNRLGVLSFANIPLLFLYAGRNNILLWLRIGATVRSRFYIGGLHRLPLFRFSSIPPSISKNTFTQVPMLARVSYLSYLIGFGT